MYEFETYRKVINMFEDEEFEGSLGPMGKARDDRRRRTQEAVR
jgi:hypothetical protein